MSWEQELGVKAIKNLHKKGLLNNINNWLEKDLTESTPLWVFFEMLNRITEETKVNNPIQSGCDIDSTPESEEKKYVVVTATALNVRDNIGGNKLGVVYKGDKLEVVREKTDWYQIKSDKISGWVHGGYVKKYNAAEEKYNYRSIRKFSSKVHIFEASQKDFIIDVTLGKRGKYEKLSEIEPDSNVETYANKKVVCKINGGFFGGGEHLWGFADEGKCYYSTSPTFPDFIYYKDGTTEIKNLKNAKEISEIQGKTNWIIGISWALIINGEINTLNKDAINHSKTRHPRTLIGQKKDGTWVLVVVEGRGKNYSLGMTANQCAELMYELNCYNAVNLDGGGSSEMIVDGNIKNSPTDGRERAIGSAVLVFKK
ncbi:MAG: phosphodiester glycosidase family protein [Vallitalea sp.]|jgi:exopolysaccharide biosynthesis protein|nr:phosphodiester glycosidase family protein [Vallitalea sp.]